MDRHGRSLSGARLRTAALVVPLLFLVVFFGFPLWTILRTGLAPAGRWDLSVVREVVRDRPLWSVAWFTLWQAAASTVLTLLVGLPGAWVFARVRFPGRSLAWAALLVPFVLPTVVVGAAWSALLGPDGLGAVGPDLRGTVAAILVVHVFFNVAVVIRTVGGLWMQLDPRAQDAARVLGASRWRAWREVTLPALRSSIVAAATIVFLFCATSFGVIVVIGGRHRTLEVEVWQQVRGLHLDVAAVLALVQLTAVLVLLAIVRRIGADATGTVLSFVPPGRAGRPLRGWWARLVATAVLTGLGLLLLSPLVVLVWRAVDTPTGLGLGFYRALGSAARGTTAFVPPAEAVVNSLLVAGATAVVATILGALAAAGIAGRRRRAPGGFAAGLARLLDVGVLLPLGTSAVTVGLGLFLALDEPPLDLRDHPILLPIAHTLVALPFVVRALVPVLGALDRRPVDAARLLGARPTSAWWMANGPVVSRALAVAAGFAFAVSLGEFGATVFLSRADWPTVPVLIARFLGRPGVVNTGQAYALSVVLMVTTTIAVVVLERLRPRVAR